MNIKFYLLSQEFAAGDTYVGGEGAGDGVGGHDGGTYAAHVCRHHTPTPADIPACSHLLRSVIWPKS